MGRLRTIVLALAVSTSAVLTFLIRTDRVRVTMPPPPGAAPTICASSYFGNQCADRDMPAIVAAGERAFSGRGVETHVAYLGVRPAQAGKAEIVGVRAEAHVICVTGDAGLVRTAQFELSYGDRAVISGLIDRRSGRTLYLTQCTYWRG